MNDKTIIYRGIVVMLIVGTLLTLINQWSAFTGDEPFNWLQALLTYCVPFIVSVGSAHLATK